MNSFCPRCGKPMQQMGNNLVCMSCGKQVPLTNPQYSHPSGYQRQRVDILPMIDRMIKEFNKYAFIIAIFEGQILEFYITTEV